MLSRVITSLIIAPIIIFAIFYESTTYGILPFFIVTLTLAILSINEFFQMAMHKGINVFYNFGIAGAIILIICAFFKETNYLWNNYYFHAFTFIIIVIFLGEFFLRKFIIPATSLMTTIRGIIYISLPLSYLFVAHDLKNGKYFIFILALSIALNDIFAFFIGRKWGKTKLSSLSPKKTLEGYIGGFIASIVTIFWGLYSLIGFHALILGIITGIMAPISDLFESFIKRSFDVKDSGDILPGHGGVLDRIDSFIFLIPLYYFYLFWILKL